MIYLQFLPKHVYNLNKFIFIYINESVCVFVYEIQIGLSNVLQKQQ